MKGHAVCLLLFRMLFIYLFTSTCLSAALGAKHNMGNALNTRNASCWDATHPDAKLHVLTAVDLHAFIQQANLLKVLPVDHKAANQSRAPEMERGKPEEKKSLVSFKKCVFLQDKHLKSDTEH